ncbi:MAG: enoyl-CoA hydratase-related protein [Acidimicrobiia bacterium]
MRSYLRIRYEETPQAVWITLARPDELNLVDDVLLEELRHAFLRATQDPDRSVVVLRGSGRMFSGGGNLESMGTAAAARGFTLEEQVRMQEHVLEEYPIFGAIENCPKTTIAALNGDAFGAGLDLALLCDLVISVSEAKFVFAPARWGLCDTPNASRLARRIGMGRAKDLLFTGRPVRAAEAMDMGLVNRLCPRARFDEAIADYVDAVLQTSPEARRLMKRVMHRELAPLVPTEHIEGALGADFAAGMRAFAAKQPAPWTSGQLARQAGLSDEEARAARVPSTSGLDGRRPPYTPLVWRLRDFTTLDKTPDVVDPESGGSIWKIWNLDYHRELHALYAVVHPGHRTGAHTHPDANHYTCVIRGTALVWMEGQMLRLRQGDVVNIPIGVLHDFGADLSGDCWVIDLTSPAFDPELMAYDPSRELEIAEAFARALR